MILKTEIDRQEYIDRGTPSNEGDGFIADPLPLFNKKKITSLYRTPTDKRNGEANQSSKSDGFEIFDKFDNGLLKNDQKILNNQYDYRSSSDHTNNTKSLAQKHQENLVRSGDGQWKSVGKRGEKMRRLMKRMTVGEDIGRASYVQNGTVPNFAKSSQNLSDMKENHTHVEAEIRSGIITAVSDGNPAFVEEVGSSDVDHQRKNSTITDGGESKPEVKEPENRMKKQVFDKINGRSNRALVKRGTANRYRVRKNNKYLYQKRRRVPDYYYDSYEDITSR
nr:unnamed protein product [Callosobruchus chinensis]